MRFKVKASELINALSVVENVTPCRISAQGGTGYLFQTHKDANGNPRCYVTSRDNYEVARGDMKFIELDEDGRFIVPTSFLDNFKYMGDDVVDFEVKADGTTNTISYRSSNDKSSLSPTFKPELIKPIDEDFASAEQAKEPFASGILHEAVAFSKSFIADVKKDTEEHLKTLQIFDTSVEALAKGNGNLFATNGTMVFYFYSEAFLEHNFALHGQHLDKFVTFLSKCKGDVFLRRGSNMTFAVNKVMVKNEKGEEREDGEMVFGWAHHTKMHTKWSFMPPKYDKFALFLDKAQLLNDLNYVSGGLEGNRDKIQISYKFSTDENNHKLYFRVLDSVRKTECSTRVIRGECLGDDKEFTYNLNVNQLKELVGQVVGNEVHFRVAPLAKDARRPNGGAMFRTQDEFWMDLNGKPVGGSLTIKDENGNEKRPADKAQKCVVTRFMPSKD